MKPTQLLEFLKLTIPAKASSLITGPPGVGKTAIVQQACNAVGADLIVSHPVIEDPTDAKGYPYPVLTGELGSARATFLPFGNLERAIKADKTTVWLLDDFGQGLPATQASYMQLIHGGKVGEHEISKHILFIAATNRRTDGAGVSGILEPVKSRFKTIVELTVSLDDWCQWALTADISPEVMAFLRFRPELLHQFSPSKDLTNSPCPRTWHALSDLVKLGMPRDLEMETFSGSVGAGAAAEFTTFLRVWRNLPNLDGILLDPEKAKIPSDKDPSVLYAVATGLGRKATAGNFHAVAKYAKRMLQSGIGEFAVLMIKDACKRDMAIFNSTAFIDLSTGEMGEMLNQ